MVVDEAMVAFKGRSSLKQYMPLKPVKRGYKVWCLADAQTGYVYNFEVYTGKTANSNTGNYSMCEKVVLNLCQPLMHTQRLVAFDNFFTTYRLMRKMLSDGLYACGTVRGNRSGLPEFLTNKNLKLKRGEFSFETKSGVAAVRWKDNKDVTLLSTFHNPKDVVFVTRKQKDGSKEIVFCPEVVRTYNNIMGGVDRFDQLRERYELGRKSRKWWHRLFYFFVDLAIINSFQLYKLQHKQIKQLNFRLKLARQLIAGFSSRNKRGVKPLFVVHKKPGHVGVPNEVRLQSVGNHIPKPSETRRRCRLCSTKQKQKKNQNIV